MTSLHSQAFLATPRKFGRGEKMFFSGQNSFGAVRNAWLCRHSNDQYRYNVVSISKKKKKKILCLNTLLAVNVLPL